MKRFGNMVIGLFIVGIIILCVGLFFSPKERASLQDGRTSTGQSKAVPNQQESAPAAQPSQESAQPTTR